MEEADGNDVNGQRPRLAQNWAHICADTNASLKVVYMHHLRELQQGAYEITHQNIFY